MSCLPDVNTAAAAFEFEHWSAGYAPRKPMVHGISGAWWRGRVTALLGPNGSGKSTLLRSAIGLLRDTQGKASLGNDDPRSLSAVERSRRASYLPQASGMRFAFTVRQVVAMGRFGLGGGGHEAAVERALGRFELTDRAERVFAELSGGQQRRALLARAFAQADHAGAVALLADEPTDGLDLKHVEQAMSALRELAHGPSRLAVVVVLHDLNLSGRFADEAWLLQDGRCVQQGPAGEVLQPARLEPVYGLRLRRVEVEGRGGAASRLMLIPDTVG